jgi:ferredoxin
MFKKLDMFVYSGTGNTYKIAQCIGEAAVTTGTSYEINMIDSDARPGEYQPNSDCLLGLLAPTLGTIQPVSFFRFILGLPKGKKQKVFLASNGAWTKIGPLFVPGYVGLGLYLAALMLLIKGYQVVGITGFGMPHNWTTFIPPYWKKLENRINDEISVSTKSFAMDIFAGKRIYKRIVDLIVSVPLLPLTLLFLLIGHLFLAKTMFAGASCNGCGQCAANCPKKAIKMYGKKRKRPYWTYKCEQCMRCTGFCPQKAVDCNSIILLTYILLFTAVPIEALIVKALNAIGAFSVLAGNKILLILIYYIVVLLLGALIYAVFYLLNRIPFINKVFTCLSYTHYWRKYKQPDVRVSVLTQKLH